MKKFSALLLVFLTVWLISGIAVATEHQEDLAPVSKNLIEPEIFLAPQYLDADPNPTHSTPNATLTDQMWTVQFSFDVQAASGALGNAGAECDGTYYYTTRWASNLIHRYDLNGTMLEEFSIPGVSGLRDLAYDGTYFYGGAAANTIYMMDFTTKTLIGTISTPEAVRHIAYDAGMDAFWIGNWSTDIYLVDRSGNTLATIPAATHNTTSNYGTAYDDISPGGPFLWVFSQGAGAGTPQLIYQLDIAAGGVQTGVTHDATLDFPGASNIAGGLFMVENVYPGTVSLGGLMQGTPDMFFMYELAPYGDLLDPNPPANFTAYSDYTMPTGMLLNWTDPTTYINGTPLTNFTIEIERDGSFIASVPMGTQTYTDAGLVDGTVYTYDIYAKDLDDSTSAKVSASWTAGGAAQPTPPTFMGITSAGGGQLMAHWTNPTDNIDGTPMDDLGAINIYENGVFLATFTRVPGDTGAADSAVFTPTGSNLPYYLTAVDNETPPNESDPSSTMFPPYSAPYLEDFEGATPGTPGTLPNLWTNETDDDFDWYVDEGGTSSLNTGPDVDHTTGTAAGNYMYTESSSPNYPNKIAHLTTPTIDMSAVSQPGLSFWYHMFGAAMGELHVDVFYNSAWVLDVMTPLVGQQQTSGTDPWKQALVDLSAYSSMPIKVRFRGITGTSFTSDMAIDDVFFTSLSGNPTMVVDPLVINDTLLVGATDTKTLNVSNMQAAPSTLNFTITENPPVNWLSVNPTSGTATSLQTIPVDVNFDATAVPGGVYTTQLVVAGNDTANPQVIVDVTLVANQAPIIAINPDTFTVTLTSGQTATDTLYISNLGNGPLVWDGVVGADLPELIYFQFDEVGASQTANNANPQTAVSQYGTLMGGMSMGGTGFAGAALIGTGGSSSSDYVDANWVFNLGSASWTLSMWLNNVDMSTTLRYHFGDNTASSFRSFTGGVAGAGGMMMRGGGLADVLISGVGPGPSEVMFVYDDAIPEVRAYLNGTLVNTVPQGGVNIMGSANFKVGGYSSSNCIAAGELMDEFKLYNRAVDVTENSRAQWLTINPMNGTIQPGGTTPVVLTIDPAGLLGGGYDTKIIINSNDPVTPQVDAGVHLTVIGQPVVHTWPDPVQFDTTLVGLQPTKTLWVGNDGSDSLMVSGVTSTNTVFTVDTTSFTLAPFDSLGVTVTFNPLLPGNYTGWIIVASNDPVTPLDSTWVEADAIEAPVIVVTPNYSNPVQVPQDDSVDVSINVANAGGSDLYWSAQGSLTIITENRRPHIYGPVDASELAELSPTQTHYQGGYLIEAPWDLQFSLDLQVATGALGNAGSEFDGTEFFTTRWASNLIHRYDLSGNMIEEFSIPGVSGLRDLAFDGTLMYGGAAGNTIYMMDFTTKTLIGTIPSPIAVRNIAYDEANDAFWVGNWNTDLGLIDRSGNQIGVIPAASHGLGGMYGTAYDSYSSGGPYLWVFDQGAGAGTPQLIHQFDLATGLATGFTYDVAADFAAAAPIAGGLWINEGYLAGTASIGGVAQGTPDYLFAYELAETSPPWLNIMVTSGTVNPGDNFDVPIRVYGNTSRAIDTMYVVFMSNDPANPIVNVDLFREVVVGLENLPEVPTTFAVSRNYPNPFNPSTTIKYQLPQSSDVRMVVYNVLGQKVRTLVNTRMEAGYYEAVWDGLNDVGNQLASGLYVLRFEAGDFQQIQKMLLMK